MRIRTSTFLNALLLVSSSSYSYCLDESLNENKTDWTTFANRGKEVIAKYEMESVNSIMESSMVQAVALSTNELFSSDSIPSQFSYGFFLGYASGFCVKKATKLVAVAVSGAFIGMQYLSYKGYVNIDYGKVFQDSSKYLDINRDGELDMKDMKAVYDKLNEALGYKIPSGGGFGTGLLIALTR